jgi:uncharacterized membrane protein YsdA (DUF1294 family)
MMAFLCRLAGCYYLISTSLCLGYSSSSNFAENYCGYGMNLNRFCYLLMALAAIGSIFMYRPLVMWFLLVNVLALVVYGVDKMAARKAWRRVPESTLLLFGFVGGWPGAIVGQQVFRHKTQKKPFKTYFIISVMLNITVLVALYWLCLHGH